jgi:hypothetical protein
LAQGPDEKCGIAGRTPGLVAVICLSFQIESLSLGRGVPLAGICLLAAAVNHGVIGIKT